MKFKLILITIISFLIYYFLFLRDISDHSNICSIYDAKPTWKYLLSRQEKKSGISKYIVLSIIKQESSFNSTAKPPRKKIFGFIPSWNRISSSEGYSQAINGTWKNYQQETKNKDASRSSFNDSIDFISWYLNYSIKKNNIDKNDYYNLYLSYHEGYRGYNKKSYNKKPKLLKIAKKVEQIANKYKKNENKC